MRDRPAVAHRGDEILKRLPPDNAVMAEVGVRAGKLSEYLLRKHQGLVLYAVDNWLPQSRRPKTYVETGDNCAKWSNDEAKRVYQEAVKRLEPFDVRAQIIKKNSKTAVKKFDDGALDLVFLDADHSEDRLTKDIEVWLEKIKVGGWIGGHDYGNEDPRFNFAVKKVVDSLFDNAELGKNHTWWVRI